LQIKIKSIILESIGGVENYMGKTKVVFITGFWRSGGTILGKSLMTSKEVIFVGEVRDFYTFGIKEDQQCSCGERFSNCNFWQNVKNDYINSFSSESIEKITEDLQKFEKWNNYFNLKKFIRNKNDKSYKLFLDNYLKHTEKLYEIISKHSGGKIIVDSSRTPVRLLAISQSTKLDVFPIFIIRDPRGVVNSFIKKDIRIYGKKEKSVIMHIIKWDIKSLLSLNAMKSFNTTNKNYLSYSYFTNNPVQVLDILEKSLNLKFEYIIENGRVSLDQKLGGHVFSGNRLRLVTGKIPIIEDVKWEDELKWTYKVLVLVLSIPLFKFIIKKYCYYFDYIKNP